MRRKSRIGGRHASGRHAVIRIQHVISIFPGDSQQPVVPGVVLGGAFWPATGLSGKPLPVRIQYVRQNTPVNHGSSAVLRITPEQLCAQYATRVARFASMAAGNDADADDIAQDALLKAIGALDRYDPQRGSLDAWLFRIVANTARDTGRRARVRDMFARVFPQPAPSADPEAAAIERSTASEVYLAIARLNARDRELLALRFGSELSTSEVGTIVGLGAESARRAIGRALERLRVVLSKGVDDE